MIHPPNNVAARTETLTELMNEWLESCKSRLKISSYQKYRTIVQNHISQIGRLSLKDLSPKAVNQILIALGMGFKYAHERYQVTMPEIHFLKCSLAR